MKKHKTSCYDKSSEIFSFQIQENVLMAAAPHIPSLLNLFQISIMTQSANVKISSSLFLNEGNVSL